MVRILIVAPLAMSLSLSLSLGLCSGLSSPASARVEPFPPAFKIVEIKTDGAVIHVRFGGQGPAVLLLHGFGDSGDMWQPLAVALMHDHTAAG
jgi:hypothetical protein